MKNYTAPRTLADCEFTIGYEAAFLPMQHKARPVTVSPWRKLIRALRAWRYR